MSAPNGVPFLRLDGLEQVHELPEAVAFGGMTSRIVTTGVPAKEFRLRLAEFLDAARAGDEIVITRSGRVTARLDPPEKETSDGD